MILLILLTGNKDRLLNVHGLDPREVEVVKVDEKRLSEPGFMLGLIKSGHYKKVYFGCIELDLQRFHTFMKLYMLLSGRTRGGLIDEGGRFIEFSLLGLIFKDIPLLIVESFCSFFVVVYYHIKLPVLKWKLRKN